jgi:hypothetical protein
MTIEEAINRRIPRVRRPMWANPRAYVRLPLLADGMAGPWAELYDDGVQSEVLGIRPGSQREMCIGENARRPDDFVPYEGAPSEFEKHAENFARSYVEA